ncbi:tandem-95 repeat protein [Vibrio sp. S4B1]|nr:tandem-95 repeat protein [Vibrio methylphosphonaticus]
MALPADEMTDEDTSISRSVPDASDVDGVIASYALQDDVPADKGSLTFNSDGSYSFDPGEDFQGLSNGESENVTFTYIALDDEGLASAPQTITITVTGINDKPVALPADEVTDEDTSISRSVPDASDVDGVIASYALQDDVPADKGSLTFNSDGSYSFDPGEDFQGLTSGESEVVEFTYYAVDNEGSQSEPKTISITVHGLNDDPESEDFAITVTNGAATPVYFDTGEGSIEGAGSDHISDIEDDRSTADDKTLSVVITELPVGGTLLYNDGGSVREIVEADLHIEGSVEGTAFDPNNISYLPDENAQGFILGIKTPQGLVEEESSQSDFLNWGEPGNSSSERVLTVGNDTITITSSGGNLTQYRGDPDTNHVGFGLGVGGGKGINQGETITIDFSDRPASSIALGLDGLGGFFDENLNNSNESSALISVTLSDGSIVELDPYQKSSSGNADLDVDLNISIADIPGAEGLLIEAVTVGTEGNGNWELRYLETNLEDSFDYKALDSDGAYSQESTVTITDQNMNANPDAVDDPESYTLIQGDMGGGDQGWSDVESIVAQYDGETVSYKIDGSDRIGIPDGTVNAGPESQIQYNRDEGESEQLVITLKEPAVDGAFSVTNLFANEGGSGNHEQGKWSAYLGNTLVASDHFNNDSGHKGSFEIETNGAAFDRLVFESVDFTDGPARGNDSSDYFLQGIQVVGAGAYVFEHDEPVVIPLSEILANDSDINGDDVRITYVFGETEGDARIEGGNVIFDLPEDFSGRTEFQYQITDDKGGFDSATVNVLVNPAPVNLSSVAFSLGDDSALEGESLSYLVTLDGTTNVKTFFDVEFGTNGDTASVNDVDLSTMTFSDGVSYNAISGELEVPEGVSEFSISLPTIDDDRYEGDESFTLLIDGQAATGSIIDNDPISLSLSGGGEVSEDAGSIGFELELSHASDVPLTVALTRVDTDTDSDDFSSTTASYNNGSTDVPLTIVNGEIDIPVGVTNIDIHVGIFDDEHYEQDEDFTLKITEPAGLTTNGVIGVTADATISDDGEIDGGPSGDNDNNAPILDLDGSENGSGYSASFIEGDAPIMVVDSDMVITDDIDVISKAEIRLTNPQTNDSLSLNGVLPAGLSLTTSTVGGALLLTITGEASADVYEAALKQLEFQNDSQDPNTESREIKVTVFDDQDLASNVATSTIDVISVNSPPESEDFSFSISGNESVAVSFDTGTGSIDGEGSDHISDIEDDINDEQVAVKITELPIGGTLFHDGVEITQAQVNNGDTFDPTKITYQASENAQGFVLGTKAIPTDSDLESTQEAFYNWGDEVDGKNRALELENGDAVTISSNRGTLTQYRGDVQDSHVGHGIGIGGGQGINEGEQLSIGFADRPATHVDLGLDGMGGYFYSGLGNSNESAVTIKVMLSDGSTVDYTPDVQKDTSGNNELFHELSFSVDNLDVEDGVLITGVSLGTDGPGNWELRYLETALNDSFTYQAVDSDGGLSEQSVVTIVDERVNNAAPTLDLDASEAGTSFASLFTEGDSAIGVVDSDVDVFDENNIISMAEVTLTNPQTADSFSVAALGNPLLSGIAYSSETLNSGAIKISLYGNASADDYEAALKLIQFENDSQTPDLTSRVIEITTFDELSQPSNTATSTIEMASVLDLLVEPASGDEDNQIPLTIDLPAASDATKVEISSIPNGAKIYVGVNEVAVVDNAVTLNELQLAQLSIQPEPNSDVDFTLQVNALDSSDQLIEQTALEVTVRPVSDTPVLSVSGDVMLASIDFENVHLGGQSWRGNVSDAELNNNGSTGIWGTENSSSVSEVGREGVYLGNQSQDKDNQIFEIEGRRNTDDSLFTDFEGQAGAFYNLTFDIAARRVNGSPVKVFLVDEQNVRSELYEFDDSVDRAWNSESIVFQTPESGSYRLLFESDQVDSYGALLDNISLSTRTNYGYEDSYIDLSDITAFLTDLDGSESLNLVLKGLPEGSIVTNGIQTLEVGSSLEADVTLWQNLEALQVLVNDADVYTVTIEATSSENDNTHPATDFTVSEVINLTVVPNPNAVPNTEPTVTDVEFFAADDTIPLNFSELVTDLEDDASDNKQTFVKIEGEPEFGQLYFLSGSGDRFDLDNGDLVEDSIDVYYDIDVGFDATTAQYESDLNVLLEQGLAISGGTYGGAQPHVNSELESIAFDGAGAAKQRGYYTKRADENGQGKETEAQAKEYMSIKFTAGLMTRTLVGVGSLTGQFSASANGGGQSNIFVYLYAGGDLISNTPVQLNNDTIVDHQATISVSSEQGFDEMRIVAVDDNGKKAGFVLQSIDVVDAEITDQFEYSAVDSQGLASVETATVNVNIVPNGNASDAESVDYAVQGGSGVTVITGTDGDDLIIGGQGSNVLTGGLGDDTFKWTESDLDGSHDVITDFSQDDGNRDVIDFIDLFDDDDTLQSLLDNNTIAVTEEDGNTLINIDKGNGKTVTIELEGVTGVDNSILSNIVIIHDT